MSILRNLLVLTPKGWVFMDEVNEGDKVYTVTPERVIKTVKVKNTVREGMMYRYEGNNGTFEGYGTANTELYTLVGHTVANGDRQTEGLETVSSSLEFLFHNPSFRAVLPINFNLQFETSPYSMNENGNMVTDMVYKKHTGLNAQRLSSVYSGLYVKAWNTLYGRMEVEDDETAMDIQHILLRSGVLSRTIKDQYGHLIVEPYDATITIESIKLVGEKERMTRFLGEDDKHLHVICRSAMQNTFIV